LLLVAPATAGPLRTAIADSAAFDVANPDAAFARTRSAGATMVRLVVYWRNVAPARRPADWDATDPRAEGYNWKSLDRGIESAVAHGLDPILVLQVAPQWAEGPGAGNDGTVRPDPVDYGQFARAAAERYSGTFNANWNNPDPYAEVHLLPRIRNWQAWNEPNRDYFLMPQYENGRMVSAHHYRAMVNRFARAVHAANPTNLVIAGGLAPLGRPGKPGPMPFMRAFLSAPVEFDVWSHHPYTSGGPTHSASSPNDAALGDLPEMNATLRAAVRSGRVIRSGSVGFWVTEFSWDTRPPDPEGLPMTLHSRWVSEALYRMWRNGVSVVTWFKLRDDPIRETHYQSGLWTVGWKAKRSLTAFRFPVVAFAGRRGVEVWGRTPAGVRGRVVVEIKTGRSWRQLGRLTTDRYGIFRNTYRTPVRRGYVRARLGSQASLPFSLTPVRDRFVNPFGCGGVIPC